MSLPRVAMLIEQYHPIIGGAEIHTRRLAAGLAQRGARVIVITGRPPGTARNERRDGLEVRRIGHLATLKLGPAKFYAHVAGVLLELWRRRGEYDIIHAQQAHWLAFAAVIAGRRLRRPSVVTLHSAGRRFDLRVLREFLPGGSRLAGRIVGGVDCAIAISETIAAELRAEGLSPDRIAPISNGVPIPEMGGGDAARARLGLPPAGLVVMFVGSLRPDKHPLLALTAFAEMSRRIADARLVFVGDGPLRRAAKAKAATLGIAPRVRFAGRVDDAACLLAAGDVFILPSDGEGLPLALLEAMARGLACVGTRVSGIVELLRDGETGLLVPPRDATALATALTRLGQDAELRRRLGAAARDEAARHYNLEDVVTAHLELYQRLLAGAGQVPLG